MILSKARRLRMVEVKEGSELGVDLRDLESNFHSFECSKGAAKLSDWMFKNGLRGDLPVESYQWRDILRLDAEKLSKNCEKCRSSRKSRIK